MEAITIHPKNKEQANLFEQLARTLKVPFEKTKRVGQYNNEFEKKMKRAEEDKKAGRYKAIKTADLWK